MRERVLFYCNMGSTPSRCSLCNNAYYRAPARIFSNMTPNDAEASPTICGVCGKSMCVRCLRDVDLCQGGIPRVTLAQRRVS